MKNLGCTRHKFVFWGFRESTGGTADAEKRGGGHGVCLEGSEVLKHMMETHSSSSLL